MPKTSELVVNAALATVLRRKHPLWRQRVHVEQSGMFKQTALRPDIIVDHPGGLPVVVETELEPAHTVEKDAKSRLGQSLKVLPGVLEQALAVQMPKGLASSRGDLTRHIEAAKFQYCLFTLTRSEINRWPATGWLSGSVSHLADCIERVSVSESLLQRGTEILEDSVRQTAGLFSQRTHTDGVDPVAELLHQEAGEQTDRMAMAILANAVIFHNVIAEPHRIKKVRELRGVTGRVAPGLVDQAWQHILDEINYWPIFDIALKVLRRTNDALADRILTQLSDTADELTGIGITHLHDMCGRMFQQLIADRKFLATFYTLPSSAALLAELAIPRLDVDWSDTESVEKLRLADLACGTGILLSAAYHSVLTRYRRTGGNDKDLHRPMMERSLIAADIMPAATHLCASMLSSAHPGETFGNTRVYTMAYGRSDKVGQPLSLGSLDLLESHTTIPIFGTASMVERGDGIKEESENGHRVEIPNGSVDLTIMNPPFTRPDQP